MKNPLKKIKNILFNSNSGFQGSGDYWEKRYSEGGNSGDGSYNHLAEFKATVLNTFVKTNNINSVIEFGCGDGNQLAYGNYTSYIGLDVSKSAIKMCIERFSKDSTKSFFLYDTFAFADKQGVFKSQLALSLDVIYHLVEDLVFEKYITHLFNSASEYVIIYSSDEKGEQIFHEKNRNFSSWINKNIKGWSLTEKINNKYPHETKADFFIYKKLSS